MSAKVCSIGGCSKGGKLIRGWCSLHYSRWRRHGDPGRESLTVADRLWAKVRKSEGCWVWVGSRCTKGYGQLKVDGRMRMVHRIAWALRYGEIARGLQVDHRCHNKSCVNPDHLRLVTASQNKQHQRGTQRNSGSGVRGVSFHKASGKWLAHARLDGELHRAGVFDTIKEADAAAQALRARLFTHDDHAEWLEEQGAGAMNTLSIDAKEQAA